MKKLPFPPASMGVPASSALALSPKPSIKSQKPLIVVASPKGF